MKTTPDIMPLPSPDACLSSLAKSPGANGSKRCGILYYPGSGTDSGPFQLFAGNGFVETIIYADYRIKESDAREFVTSLQGWNAGVIETIRPSDYGAHWWEEFWPDDERSRIDSDPWRAFAFRVKLSRTGASDVTFIFFGAEAIQTFSVISRAGVIPTVVVLQDHGFGCNWSIFGGGESPLYKIACDSGFPQVLLVAENTDPWPGYEQVSDYEIRDGQMHNHARALFHRS